MRIVLACLALGVGAIGSIGSLRAALDAGLATEGSRLLGGDISIESGSQNLPDSLRTWLTAQHGQISAVTRLRSLLVAPDGQRLLVEIKAVDGAYPLVGAVRLDSTQWRCRPLCVAAWRPIRSCCSGSACTAGDTVRLGQAQFRLMAAIDYIPDRGNALKRHGGRRC